MPTTPKEFFEEVLPSRFRELLANRPDLTNNACSLYAEFGPDSYWVAAHGGELEATAGARDAVPTFRLHSDRTTFDALLAPAAGQHLPTEPIEKLLQLEQEALDLISNVPGCLRVRIKGNDTSYGLVLGPGGQSPDNIGCTIDCALEDLQAVQGGKTQPIELLMSGKIVMDGDLQIAMALGGLLM